MITKYKLISSYSSLALFPLYVFILGLFVK